MATRDDSRWVEVSPSQFSHEREGLDSVRAWLTERGSPYRAWSNFEFRDGNGGWHECDLLVLGPGGLYLIELKHYRGTLEGDDLRWRRSGHRVESSPLLLCRRKAQRLASKLKDAARDWAREKNVDVGQVVGAVPFVQEAVFLHHREFTSHLTGSAAIGLYGLEDDDAQRRSHLPPLSELVDQPPRPGREIGKNREQILVMLMARIGLVQRRERQAGSWTIKDGVIDEGVSAQGFAWQDWMCTHIADPSRNGRIRFFLNPPAAAEHDVRKRADVARNEFRLSRKFTHPAILTAEDLVQDELGAGLVYPDDKTWERLDLWMTAHTPVPLETALSTIRQIGEGLRYAHERGIAHRTLGAGSVWVRQTAPTDASIEVKIRDWSFAGRLEEAAERGVTAHVGGVTPTSRSAGTPELAGAAEDRWMTEAFRAPESQWSTSDRVRLDVFALGALAAYVLTGRPPAQSAADLRETLRSQGGGIDVSLLGTAPEELRGLIRIATHPVVRDRTESIADFLDALDRAQSDLTRTEDATIDPLDALPGAALAEGRFVVEKRLGKGSTARGLLVRDTTAKGTPQRVLKIALDDPAATRLDAEAGILRGLSNAKSVARLIEGPFNVDGRTALLLESAGPHTLAEELRPGIPLPLDFLQRWGRDVLEAVVELDRLGVDHRDIKPSNLGVRTNPSTRALHLVLFDFSLTRAAAEAIEAGTPPYRDPFLGEGKRRRFDSAAELYSAAVVLFEMATGHPPVYGDGNTLPTLVPDEATVDPAEFPPGLAGDFADFFRQALRRDASQRFDTASAMRHAWERIFATDVTTQAPTDDDDRRAEAATLDTPLEEAGLTARGLSALARFKVHTVRDFLVKVDAGHPYHRVAPNTRIHLRQRRAAWEKRLGLPRVVTAESVLSEGLDVTVASLVDASGPEKATVRRRLVRLVLGLDGGSDAFATPGAMATVLSVPRARSQDVLDEALAAWAQDEVSRSALDAIGAALDSRIAELGGAVSLGEAAAAVLDATHEAIRNKDSVRRAQGLVRLALERRRALRAVGGATTLPAISVRRREGAVVLLGTLPAVFDAWEAVGQATEDLVLRSAGLDHTILVPAATAARELTAALDPFGELFPRPSLTAERQDGVPTADRADESMMSPVISDEARSGARLIRLGAELAPHAAAAATLDLHHVDLPQHVAIAETFRGYAGTTARGGAPAITPKELRERVRERFPAVPKLPDWPALDDLVRQSGAALEWNGKADPRGYVVSAGSQSTTGLSTSTATGLARDASLALLDLVAARLAESVETRSFLALGIKASEFDRADDLLRDRYDAEILDVTGLLIDAMRAAADRHGISWSRVVASDAKPSGSGDRANLEQLVSVCVPDVWAAIAAAVDAGTADSPVVLTDVAPLARYRHLGELSRWSDVARPRSRAVWVLAPQTADAQGPVIDGLPLPLGSPGQYLRLDLRRLTSADDAAVQAGGTAADGVEEREGAQS